MKSISLWEFQLCKRIIIKFLFHFFGSDFFCNHVCWIYIFFQSILSWKYKNSPPKILVILCEIYACLYFCDKIPCHNMRWCLEGKRFKFLVGHITKYTYINHNVGNLSIVHQKKLIKKKTLKWWIQGDDV